MYAIVCYFSHVVQSVVQSTSSSAVDLHGAGPGVKPVCRVERMPAVLQIVVRPMLCRVIVAAARVWLCWRIRIVWKRERDMCLFRITCRVAMHLEKKI